jgi:hypothetical protein
MVDPTMVLKMMSELFAAPSSVMSDVMNRYGGVGALADVEDEGDPPAFAGTKNRDVPLDFEMVLGFYDADKARITRFPKGIAYVAEDLNVHRELIELIVRYHEFAHALHHLGVCRENHSDLEKLRYAHDKTYRRSPEETKEQIAQLATLVGIRSRRQAAGSEEAQRALDQMLEGFFKLMQRQSPRYQLPQKTRDTDLPRLCDKLRLLLDMSDGSMFPSADQIRRIID